MKRSQKQQTSTNTATEVRLNRALEEIEKYKEQLLRAKSSSKVGGCNVNIEKLLRALSTSKTGISNCKCRTVLK